MKPTFEEVVSAHLDDLYRGTLLLTGGESDEAENLLMDILRRASRAFARQRPASEERFLEAQVAGTLLDRGERQGRGDGASPSPPGPGSTEEDIMHWMESLPPRERLAIWLVLVRRRSYAEAAEILSTDRSTIASLLRSARRPPRPEGRTRTGDGSG